MFKYFLKISSLSLFNNMSIAYSSVFFFCPWNGFVLAYSVGSSSNNNNNPGVKTQRKKKVITKFRFQNASLSKFSHREWQTLLAGMANEWLEKNIWVDYYSREESVVHFKMFGSTGGVMVIVTGNGHCERSSNPGQGSLLFTSF